MEGDGDAARAVGVKLADGRIFRGKSVVSNATRWDTFENLLGDQDMPEAEQLFRCILYALMCPAPRCCGTKRQSNNDPTAWLRYCRSPLIIAC